MCGIIWRDGKTVVILSKTRSDSLVASEVAENADAMVGLFVSALTDSPCVRILSFCHHFDIVFGQPNQCRTGIAAIATLIAFCGTIYELLNTIFFECMRLESYHGFDGLDDGMCPASTTLAWQHKFIYYYITRYANRGGVSIFEIPPQRKILKISPLKFGEKFSKKNREKLRNLA